MVHFFLATSVVVAIAVRKNKRLQWLPFLLLFFFAALRYMYGNDYASYFSWHSYIRNGGRSPFDGEILYTLLNYLSPSFYILIAVTSAAFIACAYKLLEKNLDTHYIWCGVLIFVVNPYLFLVNLSGIRQCVATVCFAVAVFFATKRKLLLYILWVVLAALFHKSAWLLLPIYLLCTQRKPKKRWVAAALLGAVVLTFFADIQSFVESVAVWFDDNTYLYYATQEMSNSLRATILTGIIFIYILFNLRELDGMRLVCAKLYLIGLALGMMAYQISMLTRFQMYFDIFSIVAIPAVLCKSNEAGPIKLAGQSTMALLFRCINKYALPLLVFVIYGLRYYSFFHTATWEPFYVYRSLFYLL